MSFGDLNGDTAGTTRMLGMAATDATVVKSLMGSKPVLLHRWALAALVELVARYNVYPQVTLRPDVDLSASLCKR